MTSAQTMQANAGRRIAGVLAVAALLGVMTACESTPSLEPPLMLKAPYAQDQLWAVAPFANESGVSVVNADRATDLFIETTQQVYGVNVLPLNRVILAMRELEMGSVSSPADASALMNVLGADALIVGTITTYDPYQPPRLGIAVQLHANDPQALGDEFDVQALYNSPRGELPASQPSGRNPIAQAAGVFDASNHLVRYWLDEYARGRVQPDSAYGRDIYLVSMDLYTQFVSYRLLHDLLRSEQVRLSAADP